MRRRSAFRLLATTVLATLAFPSASQTPAPAAKPALRIAAASDLRYVLDELITAMRALHPDLVINATYGSSGNFYAQIREGAPFDVFLSADTEYTRRLAAEGLAETPFPYAIGKLALVVRKETGMDPAGFGDLLKSAAIRRIAIANPAHAPYGRAAEAAMRTWKVHDAVSSKLVFGDSVSQAAQFLDSGAAQAGLVALSLAKAKVKDLSFAIVPETAHPPIEQSGLILKRSTNPEAARTFRSYLVSDAGRTLFERHGFSLPPR
jgi:molybdate transport system substrate-binding protein